jgi:hypothetical protein
MKSQDCNKMWLKPMISNFLHDTTFYFSSVYYFFGGCNLSTNQTGHGAERGAVAICQVDRLCMTRQDCQRAACLDMHMLYTCAIAIQIRADNIFFLISKSGSSYQTKPESFIQILRVENNECWLFYWMPQSLNKMFFLYQSILWLAQMLTDSCVCVWGLKMTIILFK